MPASGGGGWVLKKVGAWRRRSICSTSQPTISRPTTPKPPSPTPQGARRSPTFRNLFAALGQRSSTRPSKAHRHTSEDDIEVDVPLSIEHHQSSASIESPRSSNHYETMSSLHPESPGGGGGGGGGGGELEAVAPQVREHALKSFYATDIEAAYIIRSNNRNLGNMRPLHRDGTSALEREYDTADSWTLGKGGFGRVITARSRRTGALFAVKSVPLADLCEEDLAQLRTEIEIQRKLEHPNIVRIYEVFEDDWDAEMHLVMEMCEQCLMSHLLQSPDGHDEARVATMVSQMLSAILFCHRSGVVHRDIKLQNFMYASPAADAELKLIDFGFACEVRRGDAEQMSERLGTPSYMAPELCGPPPLCYDSKVDMWATGVVTYQLLCGDRPFHHESKEELRRRIREDEVRYAWGPWRTITDDAKDFCQKLLRRDATTRLSASAALEHKWIRERHRGGSSGGPGGGGAGGGAKRRQPLPREVIKSLRGFEQASDLKKLALEAVAVSAPPAHLTELRAVFARMDTSGRGTLTRAQFHEALAVRDEQSQQSRGTRPSSMRREQSSPSVTTATAAVAVAATATATGGAGAAASAPSARASGLGLGPPLPAWVSPRPSSTPLLAREGSRGASVSFADTSAEASSGKADASSGKLNESSGGALGEIRESGDGGAVKFEEVTLVEEEDSGRQQLGEASGAGLAAPASPVSPRDSPRASPRELRSAREGTVGCASGSSAYSQPWGGGGGREASERSNSRRPSGISRTMSTGQVSVSVSRSTSRPASRAGGGHATVDLTAEEVDSLFDALDVGGSGEVHYGEFLAATISSRMAHPSEAPSLLSAFSLLDRDHDGFVTAPDLLEVLGSHYTEDDVREMIAASIGAVATPSGGNGGEGGGGGGDERLSSGPIDRLSFQDFKQLMITADRRVSSVCPSPESSRRALPSPRPPSGCFASLSGAAAMGGMPASPVILEEAPAQLELRPVGDPFGTAAAAAAAGGAEGAPPAPSPATPQAAGGSGKGRGSVAFAPSAGSQGTPPSSAKLSSAKLSSREIGEASLSFSQAVSHRGSNWSTASGSVGGGGGSMQHSPAVRSGSLSMQSSLRSEGIMLPPPEAILSSLLRGGLTALSRGDSMDRVRSATFQSSASLVASSIDDHFRRQSFAGGGGGPGGGGGGGGPFSPPTRNRAGTSLPPIPGDRFSEMERVSADDRMPRASSSDDVAMADSRARVSAAFYRGPLDEGSSPRLQPVSSGVSSGDEGGAWRSPVSGDGAPFSQQPPPPPLRLASELSQWSKASSVEDVPRVASEAVLDASTSGSPQPRAPSTLRDSISQLPDGIPAHASL